MATGITEADVWQAADALLLEGARPTIERVRLKIGRGSPNTVSPYLETWFRILGARIKDPGAFAAAPALPDPISQAAAHFWEAAMAEARAQMAQVLAERQALLQAQQVKLQEKTEELGRLEARLLERQRDMEESLKLAKSQAASAENRLLGVEDQLRQRDEQLAQSRRAGEEARAALAALTLQEAALRTEQEAALARAQERHSAHERRWLADLDAERVAGKRLQARLDEQQKAAEQAATLARTSLDRAQAETRQAEQTAAHERAQRQSLEVQLKATHEALAFADRVSAERQEDMRTQLQLVRRQVEDLSEQVQRRNREQEALAEQLKQRDRQLDDLTRVLAQTHVTPREPDQA